MREALALGILYLGLWWLKIFLFYLYTFWKDIMEDKTEAIKTLSTACIHYCREDSVLFFAQLVSECEIRGVSSQQAKFHLAVFRLPLEEMLGVWEIIFPPPKEKPYTKLKDEPIKRTSMSRKKSYLSFSMTD